MPITKSPKIVQFSVGHDGSHALLVAEDGSVFFTGSASKGEDGESSKFGNNMPIFVLIAIRDTLNENGGIF